MSIRLGDIYLLMFFLILRFCLVWTKPCGWVKKWSEYIQTICGFLRFRFRLVHFAIFLSDWFSFEHP